MPDLVTFGETCVALVAKSRGPLRHATEFERRPGGAESTVAAGVARLGHGAGWMSRLGRDEFGAYVLGVMRSEGVDTAAVRVDPHARTGVFFRDNRADGRSSVIYYRKHSAFAGFGPDDLDEDYIASARILHLTGITPGLSPSCRAATLRAVEIARANGVAVVFDPNYRAAVWPPEEARPCIEDLMLRSDHVLAGREDLVKLTGLAEERAQLDYLHALGLPSVVLKLGARGAVLSCADGAERVEGYGAEPRSIGSGRATPSRPATSADSSTAETAARPSRSETPSPGGPCACPATSNRCRIGTTCGSSNRGIGSWTGDARHLIVASRASSNRP